MDPFLAEGASFKRLYDEFIKYGSLYIGYDFDNTVYDVHNKGNSHKKVIQLLQDLKKIGCICICWTAQNDLNLVEKYCKDNDIPLDGINCDGIDLGWSSRKPMYSALLDDRAGLRQVYNDLSVLVKLIKKELYKTN
jgi:hypothetical protein